MLIHPDALWLLLGVPGMLLLWWASPAAVSRRGWWVTAGLRVAAVALLVIALAQPARFTPGEAGSRRLVVLADASLSLAPAEAARARQLVTEAGAAARAAGVPMTALAFARRTFPGVEDPAVYEALDRAPAFRAQRDATDLAAALDDGLGALQANESAAIVLASDGLHTTGDLEPAVARAARAGVPVHVLPLDARKTSGVGIARFEAPARAYAGDVVELIVTLRSSEQGVGTLTVYRGDKPLHRQRVQLARGVTTVTVKSKEPEPAVVRFRAKIEPELIADDLAEDDERLALTEVRAVPRVLVVSDQAGLTTTLRGQGIAAEQVAPEKAPGALAGLARYAVVVLDDVVAKRLPAGFMPAVEASTRDRGTGFFMIGGQKAFEQGGYVGTPIDRMLPVDLLRVTKEADAAVVVLLDCSWSMAGWPLHEGRRACQGLLKLLEGRNVAMLSFAAAPAEVFPMQMIGADRSALDAAIDRVRPRGGTDLYEPLRAAERLLGESSASASFVILLTDGEPEEKRGLVEQAAQMATRNIQLSTVRVSKLPETQLLAQLAREGGGRYYQAADFAQLSKMFENEASTITMGARTSRGSFAMQVVKPASMVRGFAPQDFPPFAGMNITRVKERAEPLLAVAPRQRIGPNQGALPLLAVWRVGLGLSLAFTADSGAGWTASWRNWSEHGRFWSQLVKGVMPCEPTAFAVRTHVRDGGGSVTVDAIRPDGGTLDFLPLEARVTGPAETPATFALAQQDAGRYLGRFDATRRGFYAIEVTRRDTGAVVGATGLAQSDAGELEPRSADVAALARISAETGGRVIGPGDLAAVVAAIRAPALLSRRDYWPALSLLALMLFLLEVLLRRTGALAADPATVATSESAALAAAEREFERARALDDAGELRAAATHYLDAYRRYGRAGASERAATAWARYRRAEERSKS